MKLIDIKKVDDCFDGSVIFQYAFDREINERLMEKVGKKGTIQYYPEFLRPFFKIVTADGLQVKGTIGNTKFEVIYPNTDKQGKKINFETLLKKYLGELGCDQSSISR